MTNTEKAIRLINTLPQAIQKSFRASCENYIQHNPRIRHRQGCFVGSVSYLASAPVKTTVKQHSCFRGRRQRCSCRQFITLQVWASRLLLTFSFDENGKIAEHWDNIASKAEPNPSGHTQTDGTMEINDLDKTETNRGLIKTSFMM